MGLRSLEMFASASVLALTLTLAQTAAAQTAGASPGSPAPADSTTVSEVVVTGTHIQSIAGYARPTPVTAVTAETLNNIKPTSIAEGLVTLPQFSGSETPSHQWLTVLSSDRGDILNLRDLGPNRTLVLLDGERMAPTTAHGLVDVDVIPELLVSRVDVVTAGVSAVYGSDAIAGVVNYILDHNFTGVKMLAQWGVSTYGDGQSYKIGAAVGHAFANDRVHLTLSFDRTWTSDDVWADNRPFMRDRYFFGVVNHVGAPAPGGGVYGFGTPNNPLVLAPHVVGSSSSDYGKFQSYFPGLALTNLYINPEYALGNSSAPFLLPFDPGVYFGPSGQIGGSGINFPIHRTLIGGVDENHGFGRFSFDITPKLTFSVEAFGSETKTTAFISTNFATAPIFASNAFLPPSAAAAIAASPAQLAIMQQLWQASPNGDNPWANVHTLTDVKNYMVKTGISGEIFPGWNLTADYIHGWTHQYAAEYNEFNQQHFYAAIDSEVAPAGNAFGIPAGTVVCHVQLTQFANLYPGCVPFNPFQLNSNSAAVRAYVLGTSTFDVVNVTNDIPINISGHPFSTWAGPVGVAVGFEYRTASLKETSNSNPAVPFEHQGIRGGPLFNPNLDFGITSTGFALGSDKVKEFNLETEIPLAKDMPLLHSLNLSAAVRWADYSTSGWATTWKLGATWEPIDGVRLRYTTSRDFQAPSLFNLFSGATTQSSGGIDPHIQCNTPGCNFSGSAVTTGGGNPDLKPEISLTTTYGVVFQPRIIPGLQASIDYYDIRLSNAITTLTSDYILGACEASNGTSSLCSLITRPLPFSNHTPANIFTAVNARFINAASFRTSGIDFEGTYRPDLFDRSLTLHANVNWVRRFEVQSTPTGGIVDYAGWTDNPANGAAANGPIPYWRGTFSANFNHGPWSLNGDVRWIGKLRAGPLATYQAAGIPDWYYFDTTINYNLNAWGRQETLFLTITDLFNKGAPLWPYSGGSGNSFVPSLAYPTIQALYDVMGRYYTIGIRAKF